MCCCGFLSENSPEYNKRYKPESNSGCCKGGGADNCSQPSKAANGSPLWNWEQKYGKLVDTVYQKLGEDGRFYLFHEKTACQKVVNKKKNGCCSMKYKIIR